MNDMFHVAQFLQNKNKIPAKGRFKEPTLLSGLALPTMTRFPTWLSSFSIYFPSIFIFIKLQITPKGLPKIYKWVLHISEW